MNIAYLNTYPILQQLRNLRDITTSGALRSFGRLMAQYVLA